MAFRADFRRAFEHEYGIGAEQNRHVMFEARKRKEQQADAPKIKQMWGAYRLPQVINAIAGREPDTDWRAARADAGAPIMNANLAERLGTLGGALMSDITQDNSRKFWWLLNAPQAAAEVIAEAAMEGANPELYAQDPTGRTFRDKRGNEVKEMRPRHKPGFIQALSIPSGIAINTALGLMTPFGGAPGYKAVIPSEEDPNKSDNVIAEVAAKYILGRTGNLLPYEDFVKHRPDVSQEEYNRYKAFKWDKEVDMNPFDDGQVTLPAAVAKYTSEGIHGPEVQFLGRSLPVSTGIIPYASAVAGGMIGVRRNMADPIPGGFRGGTAGLVVGSVVGNIIENERRRRNTVENELDGTLR